MRAQRRREPVDLPEPARPDRRLAELGRLRTLRIAAAEREQQARRRAWRGARGDLHAAIVAWRTAERRARDDWQAARAAFFAMRSSSNTFRAAKGAYDRARRASVLARAAARDDVAGCRAAGRRFFAACEQLAQARRREEKLRLLDEELRRQLAREDH